MVSIQVDPTTHPAKASSVAPGGRVASTLYGSVLFSLAATAGESCASVTAPARAAKSPLKATSASSPGWTALSALAPCAADANAPTSRAAAVPSAGLPVRLE